MNQRPSITLRYYSVEISADVTLDAQPVWFAFMPIDEKTGESDEPGVDDWEPATWIGPAATKRVARLNLGPDGDVTLENGLYAVWYWVDGSPEIPKEPVERLRIT